MKNFDNPSNGYQTKNLIAFAKSLDAVVRGNTVSFDSKNYLQSPEFRSVMKINNVIFSEKINKGKLVYTIKGIGPEIVMFGPK